MNHKVLIEDFKIKAYHGVYEEERQSGSEFVVNIEITTDFSTAAQTDNIKDALDYEKVCSVVKEEMKKPAQLLENVGQRIVNRLKRDFSPIQKIKIKISKLHPLIKGSNIKATSIEIEE